MIIFQNIKKEFFRSFYYLKLIRNKKLVKLKKQKKFIKFKNPFVTFYKNLEKNEWKSKNMNYHFYFYIINRVRIQKNKISIKIITQITNNQNTNFG